MQLGFIGLGKMGSRMAEKLITEGHDIIVWNRSKEPVEKLCSLVPHLKVAESIEKLIRNLQFPRIIWMMLPAGIVTEQILNEVILYVQKGDIIIDGGNANYNDTKERFIFLKEKGIRFLGIGVSGGIIAAREGYPLMVGGDKSAYDYIIPILDSLGSPNGGHAYFGIGGAGHFVKMVHNGIEYGMMQAIGEGFAVLEKSSYNFRLLDVATLWQKGTIISSFLIDRAKDALKKDEKLSDIEGIISASGEAEWTVEEAKKEKVDVPIIEESLVYRKKSQTDTKIQKSFTAKMVSALRHEFGGHEVVKKK
jgi:6-phosphogluconate dehydrogenase